MAQRRSPPSSIAPTADGDKLSAPLVDQAQASATVVIQAMRAAAAAANQPIDSGFVELDSPELEDIGARMISSADGSLVAVVASGDADNDWRITGEDSGTLNGVAFSGANILLGGAGNEDTFTLEQDGRLTGFLDGGPGGFDSLVVNGGSGGDAQFNASAPDSGSVALGDDILRYFGLEPTTDNSVQANKTVNGTAGVDHITIDDTGGDRLIVLEQPLDVREREALTRPTHLLTVNAGANDDLIDFEALFFSPALVIFCRFRSPSLNLRISKFCAPWNPGGSSAFVLRKRVRL